MLSFQSLENQSLQYLVQVFNKAFSEYFVPIQMTKNGLEQKMDSENIMLRFSIGAFDRNELGGFILHGLDTINGEKIVYNGGTGVIPSFRGQGITRKLYQSIIPLLQVEDVKKCRLEVIDINYTALYVYEKIGFQKARKLRCYRGTPNFKLPDAKGITVKEVTEPDWSTLPEFWLAEPTWQNSVPTMRRGFSSQKFIGLFDGNTMAGYGIVNPSNGRLGQFGIHPNYRGQGLGKLLFWHLGKVGNPKLTTINIDEKDTITHSFLLSLGFEDFLGQYEMEMEI